MTRAFPILILLCLTACGVQSTRPELKAPVPNALPAEIAAPCPALPLLTDPTPLSAFLLISADDALQYARCQAKHAGAVAAYEVVRQSAIATNAVGDQKK